MKQMSFADAEYAGKRKQTRRERFLIEMDQVMPWKCLIALIEPHYPKGEGGRPAYPLMAMQMEGVLADVDTQKRHGVHERPSFGKKRNPICLDSPGFSSRADHLIKEISIILR